MDKHTVSLFTLHKKSLRDLEVFRQKHGKRLSEAAADRLRALKAFLGGDDEKAARRELRRLASQLRRALRDPEVRAEFDNCQLDISAHAAFRQYIPPGRDDFIFYLDGISEIKALLRLLRGAKPRRQRVAEGPEKPDDDEEQPDDPYYDADTVRRHRHELHAARQLEEESRYSYDRELWLWDDTGPTRKVARGRALACRSHQNSQWSVTFRRIEEWPDPGQKDIYLNKLGDIGDLLRDLIFEPGSHEEHGLIVITGRTGSGKSQIAYRLIESCLARSSTADKHLPTFEDPIERYFYLPNVRYTPREKGKDVSGLDEAISDALRQKPAVLFVGETRAASEWQTLVKFAGTGHLVVTTAHAGSLVEAMSNILQATQALRPADRSVVGERLLAVIHLKPARVPGRAGKQVGIIVPTLWRRTPEGIKALMAEGLSSLNPHTPRPLRRRGGEPPGRPPGEKPFSSIGRYWFALELLDGVKLTEAARKTMTEAARQQIKTDALEWDLEGV